MIGTPIRVTAVRGHVVAAWTLRTELGFNRTPTTCTRVRLDNGWVAHQEATDGGRTVWLRITDRSPEDYRPSPILGAWASVDPADLNIEGRSR